MTSVLGLEISIFRIPLDATGSQLISQQCGYFHLWRFLNADGSVSIDGEIGASFGGQWNAERVPFTYNSRIALVQPVDRVLLEWTAQPGKIAEILMTKDPRGLDGQNAPAKQLVIQGSASSAQTSLVSVGTSAQLILSANAFRARAVLQADDHNSGTLTIGTNQNAVGLGQGVLLKPGASMEWLAGSAIWAISDYANNTSLRILQELS